MNYNILKKYHLEVTFKTNSLIITSLSHINIKAQTLSVGVVIYKLLITST